MVFPWRFNDRSPFALTPSQKSLKADFDTLTDGFKQSYIALLNSIANQELADIEDFSTSPLSAALKESFFILNNRKHSIDISNKECEDMTNVNFYNEKAIIYVPENLKNFYEIYTTSLEKALEFMGADLKFGKVSVKFQEDEELRLAIQVDALFVSPFKLIMLDENKNVVQGDTSAHTEIHLVKYEVSKPIQPQGLMQYLMLFPQIYIKMAKGTEFYKDCDWKVIDIDNFLKDNPSPPNE